MVQIKAIRKYSKGLGKPIEGGREKKENRPSGFLRGTGK
jgi:hypothetical protein